MEHRFLQQRRDRAITSGPEEGRVSERLDGRAWNPEANGAAPVLLAPAADAAVMQTSLSRWGAYLSRQDAEKIEEVSGENAAAEDDLKLPVPAMPQNRKLDVWGSTRVEGFSAEASRQGYTSEFGADYVADDGVLVGASVELEDLQQAPAATGGATVTGSSFMVGPYMATRLVDNLVFDSRIAWGRGHDTVDEDGTARNFATERGLAKARLKGDFHLKDWQLSSTATFIYAAEVPNGGLEHAVVTRNLSIGPEIRRPFRLDGGQVIEPFLHYRETVDLEAGTGLSDLDALAIDGTLGGGVSITKQDDYTVQATTSFEGVGVETDPNVTGRVQVTVPLD